MKRKEFIQKLLVNGSIAAVLPSVVLQSCEKSDDDDLLSTGKSNQTGDNEISVDLNDTANSSLQTVGGFIQLSESNIILINTGNNEFVALSSLCTHQSCTVTYSSSANTLPCPCHGSVFNIDGSVNTGPASSPLKLYDTEFANNIITISI